MSKLLKLKEWVTVPEAAKRLTIVCGEEVGEADILRFALDGHLKLSSFFPNEALAKIAYDPSIDANDLANEICEAGGLSTIEKIRLCNYLTKDNECEFASKIKGVFDLLMFGNNNIYVERKYQEITGGTNLKKEYSCGTMVEDIRKKFKFVLVNASFEYNDVFLPEDSFLVVRTESLRDFEKMLSESDQSSEVSEMKIENPKSIDSLLKMVMAMAIKGYNYDPSASRSAVPSEIVSDADAVGYSIEADTVRKWLKEGVQRLPRKEE